jgi:hypothetical protein
MQKLLLFSHPIIEYVCDDDLILLCTYYYYCLLFV